MCVVVFFIRDGRRFHFASCKKSIFQSVTECQIALLLSFFISHLVEHLLFKNVSLVLLIWQPSFITTSYVYCIKKNIGLLTEVCMYVLCQHFYLPLIYWYLNSRLPLSDTGHCWVAKQSRLYTDYIKFSVSGSLCQ